MAEDWAKEVNKKHPTLVEHLPATGKVFAILQDDSYSYNSGYENDHGSTCNYINMEVFPTEAEWKAEIERRAKDNKKSYYTKSWKAVIISIPEVKITVAVNVDVKGTP